MDKRNGERFNYEEARRDMIDNGLDPDYLSEYARPEDRDRLLRKNGLDPDNYKPDPGKRSSGSKSSGFSIFEDSNDSSENTDSSCFLTTACIRAKGLPDDCLELETLRSYRDNWLRTRENGAEVIRQYYERAPQIVEKINRRSDAGTVWDRVYEEMILPCVSLIQRKEYEETFRLYKAYTLELEKLS